MSLFTPRYHYKPFEYPEVIKFTDLIAQTYWVVNELNFDSDVHDFHNLSNYDQHVITTCAKAISQVEVAVKKFGSSLDSVFPKPEISGVGSVWAESEFRHSEAYSKILDILGISDFYEL